MESRKGPNPRQPCELFNMFFTDTEPILEDFDHATGEFKMRVRGLTRSVGEKIEHAHQHCRGSRAVERFVAARIFSGCAYAGIPVSASAAAKFL